MEEEILPPDLNAYVLPLSVFLTWDVYTSSLGQDRPLGKAEK